MFVKNSVILQRDSMSLGVLPGDSGAENIPIGSDPDNTGVENNLFN
jgi:hypothetical protein